MDIQTARMNARNCLSLAIGFQELSPSAQNFLSAFGGVNYGKPKNQFVYWIFSLIKKILHWRLDKLILINDSSVRVMTLKAMNTACYKSLHLGFITTLYVSDEIGFVLNKQGEKIFSEGVSTEVWRYFLTILDIPNYFDDIQGCANHWEGVLSIDYTKEFSVENRLDFSSGKPERIHRNVPPEEVKDRIVESKAKIKKLYKYDVEKLFEKFLANHYKRRVKEVYESLDEIFKYIFNRDLNNEVIAEILHMLARIARMGHFPERWLLKFTQKYVK